MPGLTDWPLAVLSLCFCIRLPCVQGQDRGTLCDIEKYFENMLCPVVALGSPLPHLGRSDGHSTLG